MTQTPEPTYADDAQRYRLDSRIATGGMGEVWRGTDTLLDREVAIKLLKDEIADDPVFRSRFETEARHAAALHHPGIASVFDVGERARPSVDGGRPRPYLVMELVEGQPLSALLTQGRDLDPDAVRDLMAQVGDALGAAHRAGIIHRDVKPANLIVTPDGQVKVTDFGIARAADGAQITRTGAVMGTPQYLSPEQAEGKPATIASDVYSLGVVTFECLAGRRPFDAESPIATALAHIREPVPELPAGVPADLATVVRRSLSKDAGERYPDGAAFAAALRNPATAVVPTAARAVPVVAPESEESRTQVMAVTPVAPIESLDDPITTTTAAPESSRNATGPIVAAVVLLIALGVVVALLLVGGGDEQPAADDTSSQPSRSRSAGATPSETPASQTPPPDTTIVVDEGAYLDRGYEEVASDLRGLGLRVEPDEQPNDDPSRNGLVTGLDPDGEVQANEVIVVTYDGAAPEATPTPTPEVTPTPTPTATPTPTPSPTPTPLVPTP